MKQTILYTATFALLSLLIVQCNQTQSGQNKTGNDTLSMVKSNYGGFSSQVEWGKHLVAMGGCEDCHTPKKMTAHGPVPDTSMYLAGHPAQIPPPEVNRKEIESKGLIVTNDLSVWVGPWGITYADNITPDETGIGNWNEDQFLRVFREGKWKGLEGSRPLLPPMSFVAEGISNAASDNELKAIFVYLKSIRPVHNMVPPPAPPVTAAK
ncbi:MAG: diheme cytochrome c-553 [Chitinophagaceae bacterium]